MVNELSPLPIITYDGFDSDKLSRKTTSFEKEELPLAKEIAHKLKESILPYVPAAGLAAPQIGFLRSIFIYSYDRDPKHLEVVINPKIISYEEIEEGWEGCFSTILSEKKICLAKLPRYKKIVVEYLNLEGKVIRKKLEGFAAKAFQHEYDHLHGIVNIYKEGAKIQKFGSKEAMLSFMKEIKAKDSASYIDPNA